MAQKTLDSRAGAATSRQRLVLVWFAPPEQQGQTPENGERWVTADMSWCGMRSG